MKKGIELVFVIGEMMLQSMIERRYCLRNGLELSDILRFDSCMTSWWLSLTDAFEVQHDAELHHVSPSDEDLARKTSKRIGTKDFYSSTSEWIGRFDGEHYSIDIEI